MKDRIAVDPKVHHGQPVIRGTRVPVAVIVGSLAGGMTAEEVANEYGVSTEDVRAALGFAAELIEHEQHFPLAG